MSFIMSEILSTIRTLTQNELGDLGDSETEQNNAIFGFTNVVLRKRARQAYQTQWSDVLNITTNGYQTFNANGSLIADLYEPLMLYNVSGSREAQTAKRPSFDIGNGWFRDAENQSIHTYGLTGNHKLHYIRYPAVISVSSDTIEFPKAGQWDLIMDVVALCKLPKNFYQEYDAVKKNATGTATVKASMAARGTNSAPPSIADKEE
jgi:hypothetical protein